MTLFPYIFLFFLAQAKCNSIYHFSSLLDQYTTFFSARQVIKSKSGYGHSSGLLARPNITGWTACSQRWASPRQNQKLKINLPILGRQNSNPHDLLNHMLQSLPLNYETDFVKLWQLYLLIWLLCDWITILLFPIWIDALHLLTSPACRATARAAPPAAPQPVQSSYAPAGKIAGRHSLSSFVRSDLLLGLLLTAPQFRSASGSRSQLICLPSLMVVRWCCCCCPWVPATVVWHGENSLDRAPLIWHSGNPPSMLVLWFLHALI